MSISKLDVPGIEALTGAGVYYGAAVTEAAHYKGEHVFIVGGANSAGQGALFVSRYAGQVTMLIRSDSLEKSMSQYLVEQIENTDNIEVLLQTEVVEVHGRDQLEAITTNNNKTGENQKVPAAAMLIFIGARPHSDIVADVVQRNEAGFILTGQDLIQDGRRPQGWALQRDPFLLETSVPGIFAAGDIRHGSVKRVSSAVGQGSVAISFVEQYLATV